MYSSATIILLLITCESSYIGERVTLWQVDLYGVQSLLLTFSILQSSPDHEGLHVGTLCLCSRDGGCGDSLCVHSSGGCDGEPGTHQDSPC